MLMMFCKWALRFGCLRPESEFERERGVDLLVREILQDVYSLILLVDLNSFFSLKK